MHLRHRRLGSATLDLDEVRKAKKVRTALTLREAPRARVCIDAEWMSLLEAT